MRVFAVFFFLLSVNYSVYCDDDESVEKPSWLNTCSSKDPDFVSCHLQSIQNLFANVFNGNYKVKGIDSIEPYKLDKVQILQGSGPVSVDASLKNVDLFGLPQGSITNVSANFDTKQWSFVFKIPKLRIESDYQMKGQILIIPLNGKGKCFLEPTDMKVKIKAKSKLYEKNGHTYFDVLDTNVQFKMEGLKLRFSNLFEGSKELDQTINQYLNENWKAALDALKPIISKTIEDIMLPIVQNVYKQLPGDYIISDLADYI